MIHIDFFFRLCYTTMDIFIVRKKMKNTAIFMLFISAYSINSMHIQKQVWHDINYNQDLANAFFTHQFNPLRLQNPSTKPRLAVFVAITQKIDEMEKQERLKLQELQKKRRNLATQIKLFINETNCNKRKTFSPYGYTLHNNNGIIAETKNRQKPTYFNAKDVRGVRIDDNFSIEILFY